MTAKEKQKGELKMSAFSFRLEESLLKRLRSKAGRIPLAIVVRVLLEKWLKGDIEVDFTKE
jgi:hypothetical protein